MNHTSKVTLIIWVILLAACGVEKPEEIVEAEQNIPQEIDFNLHVKPILSDRCFACHGPDNNTREAGLRLDTEEGAFAKIGEEKDHHAIVPGNLRKSAVYERLVSHDPEVMMPPPASNLSLTNEEKAIIIKWIEQGAEWKKHWAFIPPQKSKLPEVKEDQWVKNEIDYFVLRKLSEEALRPSEAAEKTTLIRRLYFDLTGLPPSPGEVEAFVTDPSPNAYENVVDRLLASDANAERLAMDWMDVARYADSHGYHADGYRLMWPWRDWAIKAFKQNMPYDKFITWQIAGDLLPNATREQILATAFNRNHPMTAEGGIIDEEYRMEYVFDRTNTTSRALLGVTMECAQCHDHKYDPFSQKEFYQLSAFYNNLNELGMTGDDGNAGPVLQLTEEDTRKKLDYINKVIGEKESKLSQRIDFLADRTDHHELSEAHMNTGLIRHYPLDDYSNGKSINIINRKLSASISGEPERVEGIRNGGLRSKADYDIIELDKTGLYEMNEPFTISFWVKPEEHDQYQELFGNAGNKNSYWRGYEAFLDSVNHIEFKLIHAKPHNLIHVKTTDSIPLNEWSYVTFTYAGNAKASDTKIYINGQPANLEVVHDNLYKSILPITPKFEVIEKPLRFGRSYSTFSGDDGIFTGSFDDIRIYNRPLTAMEVAGLYASFDASDKNGDIFNLQHWAEFLSYTSDPKSKNLRDSLTVLRKDKMLLMDSIKEVMVMKEMEKPRKTYVLDRGAYDAPKEEVEPGTPEVIMPFPDS